MIQRDRNTGNRPISPSILILFSVIVFTYIPYKLEANPHSGLAMVTNVNIGTRAAELLAFAQSEKAKGATVKRNTMATPGGPSESLFSAPGMLALLNRFDVKHPFFSNLEKTQPEFITVERDGTKAIYGISAGSVWAIAMELPVQPDSKSVKADSPFSYNRLDPIRSTWKSLETLCGTFKVTERDRYGNPRLFSGNRCGGGTLYVIYDPTEEKPFRILIHQ